MTEVSVRESLALRFARFREQEASAGSPLYSALSDTVAQSEDLLELASHARPGQQVPNLFFASVHRVLRDHADHSLASHYPSVGGSEAPDGRLGDEFRRFVSSQRESILRYLRTGLVQTNEPRRAAAVLAGLAGVEFEGAGALIEVGASAGLNLLFDRYRIAMGEQAFGPEDARVAFTLDSIGEPIPERRWELVERVGVDLAPIDAADRGSTAWLESLVWPDQSSRLDLLRAALDVARAEPPELVAGDLLEVLPEIVSRIPADREVIVFHSATWAHLTKPDRQRFVQLMKQLAGDRRIWWLSLEGGMHEYPEGRERVPCHLLGLIRLDGTGAESKVLARFEGHGRWIDWLGSR